MADLDKVVDTVKEKAGDVAYKVRNFDVQSFMEEVKGLDMGVVYTKFLDAIAGLDIESKKQAIKDFLDSPQMDSIKDKGRLLKDFAVYVPNFAQSIPGMVEDAVEKIKKK